MYSREHFSHLCYFREVLLHFFSARGSCDAFDGVTEVFAFYVLHENQALAVAYMQNFRNIEPFAAQKLANRAFSREPRPSYHGEDSSSKGPQTEGKPFETRPVFKPLNQNLLFLPIRIGFNQVYVIQDAADWFILDLGVLPVQKHLSSEISDVKFVC